MYSGHYRYQGDKLFQVDVIFTFHRRAYRGTTARFVRTCPATTHVQRQMSRQTPFIAMLCRCVKMCCAVIQLVLALDSMVN